MTCRAPRCTASASSAKLGLDGTVRPVTGTLVAAERARRIGITGLLCAPEACAEVALVDGVEADPVPRRRARRGVPRAGRRAAAAAAGAQPQRRETAPDLADVRGQPLARRALEIAAAGAHNLLFVGPPGVGKSMLARRLPGILPALTPARVARGDAAPVGRRARSPRAAGSSPERPFRAPHHSATAPALIGGGSRAPAGRAQPRQPRRAVPRRAPRVPARRARGAARARSRTAGW